MTKGRVLVACEFSGRVRDEFALAGWEAWSADLRPSLTPGNHYQGDVLDVLHEEWDLLIAHPPCTYLSHAGVRWYSEKGLQSQPGRLDQLLAGAEFFLQMLNAPVRRIAVENPKMHQRALDLVGRPSQWIEPHEYGTLETKKTGLWLRNLPPLLADEDGKAVTMARPVQQRQRGMMGGSSDEKRHGLRSVTPPGIARAMAAQWGDLDVSAAA